MISYIIGDIKYLSEQYIVVESNNIGYKLFISTNSYESFDVNARYKIYTSLQVSQDNISLFGFYSKEELDMFNLLIGVNTIGPKNALQILSSLTVNEINNAIASNDINLLTKAKGVGRKTASRIILDLHDKIKCVPTIRDTEKDIPHKDDNNAIAFEALLNLGYMKNDINTVMSTLDTKNMSLEEIIKECLKRLV